MQHFQHLKSENSQLMMDNTQLRSQLALSNQDLKIMNLKIEMIQKNRDQLETQLSVVKSENEELNSIILELKERLKVDTPILRQKHVHFEDSSSEHSIETKSSKKDEEPEYFSESGPDFDSKWFKNLSISHSHRDYIVLKNNSKNESQSLDDFLFFRTVDGQSTVTGEPFPLGISIPPLSTFTVHSNHINTREIPSNSCILFRYETFGTGKVTENVIIDPNGTMTANYVLCVFQG